tara:strand:+ start:1055 stop:1273 length:219 start_codon:yes stop_codon:yes gene_type:complete
MWKLQKAIGGLLRWGTSRKGSRGMNCWHCKTPLIWGGDHDLEDSENFMMVTNLSCPECKSYVEVYVPKEVAE